MTVTEAPARRVPRVSDAPGDAPAGFRVRGPAYDGDLAGLARALRAGTVVPRDLDLLSLVRDVLVWFEGEADRDLELASVALPQVAQVIELKLRLLLPRTRTDPEDEEEGEETGDALRTVALLEELEGAIDFLRRRRFERALVVPARTPRPDVPRPHRPLATTAGRLASLASNLRPGGYFEMALDRLTLEGAMRSLRRALAALGRGTLWALHPARDWAERTVVFTGMLELVREGRVDAHQDEPYGEITLADRPRAAGVPREAEASGTVD